MGNNKTEKSVILISKSFDNLMTALQRITKANHNRLIPKFFDNRPSAKTERNRPIPKFFDNRPSASAAVVFW